MDFGLSQVPNTQPWGSVVPTSQAFPFWSVYFGANQVTSVGYNVQAINQAFVGLLTPDNTAEGAIAGHNTAVIQAGNLGFQGPVSAAFAQTAQIPVGTVSLLFVATPPNGAGWQVTIGGQSIPVVEVSQVNSRFNEYGANISAFAGLTEELRFTALVGPQGSSLNLGEVQFSPVPEPTTGALIVLGGVLFGLRAQRKRSA
jgi:hypothetical protein